MSPFRLITSFPSISRVTSVLATSLALTSAAPTCNSFVSPCDTATWPLSSLPSMFPFASASIAAISPSGPLICAVRMVFSVTCVSSTETPPIDLLSASSKPPCNVMVSPSSSNEPCNFPASISPSSSSPISTFTSPTKLSMLPSCVCVHVKVPSSLPSGPYASASILPPKPSPSSTWMVPCPSGCSTKMSVSNVYLPASSSLWPTTLTSKSVLPLNPED
mmetsp:Transcript_107260/g.298792  ORF Transcript_107260/g.298792 Transcript_107260/m.298792 type:complete len:219 (-) Transcript_107260:1397-2053(-)